MKLGILGTGKIVQEALPSLKRVGAESLYLLARVQSRDKAEALREKYRLDGVFYDYDELLASDIDAVYAALPNPLHYEFAKKALLAGKHALVEKPMVVHSYELEKLRELARERGLVLMEAMTVHALPAYQALKTQLYTVGAPRLAVFNYSQRSSRYDSFLAGETHAVFDPAQAGGALMDINVYNLHAILGLFGIPKAVEYRANLQRGIDTSGILSMEYDGFQAVAIGTKDCDGFSGAAIQGEKGVLLAEGPVSGMLEFSHRDNRGVLSRIRLEDRDHAGRLFHEFAAFRRMTDGGERDRAGQLLDITAAATAIMEEARRQVGILFPGDRA